jgi:hypothetical protein
MAIHGSATTRLTPPHNRSVPDAPLVIVNPIAGGGRAGRLVGWLRERLPRVRTPGSR